jgi:ABC-type microcin C transport system duplicated ATPase subunit YejF
MTEIVLAIENLKICHSLSGMVLVDDLSLDLRLGETLAIVGESGSGKSITALSAIRLLPNALEINEGSVTLEKDDIFELTENEMNEVRGRRIAMIFQEPQTSLNPVQTVGDQLREVISLHGNVLTPDDLTKLTLDLLSEVGIPQPEERINWYPHQLSGGQVQRIMIAIALACDPDVLIADEPTTALDVTIQKQVLDLLKKLKVERNLSILFITHDMGVVSAISDRVAVMHNGKIIETAECNDFFADPQHEYSKQLIKSLPNTQDYLRNDSSKTLLRVNNLHVWFPIKTGFFQRTISQTKAVDGINFHIDEGETLALVGESGCGKTTTGRAILRLCELTRGRIIFGTKLIHDIPERSYLHFRKKIQVIFQDPFSSMNPRMTVGDIIQEGVMTLAREIPPNLRDQHIRRVLDRVGLHSKQLSRYPHEFSGGQRQRIAIARALAVRPTLVICDEPTSALDVSLRAEVLRLLRDFQREEGIAYLFITHDLSLIPSFAHRVAVMKEGKIVEQGPAEDIMLNAQHPYSRELIAAAPVTSLSRRLAEIA